MTALFVHRVRRAWGLDAPGCATIANPLKRTTCRCDQLRVLGQVRARGGGRTVGPGPLLIPRCRAHWAVYFLIRSLRTALSILVGS